MFDTVRREVRLHQTDPVISRIVLVSGVDQTGWLSIPTKTPNDMFGWYVSPIGDFDGDAVEDLAVTAPASLISEGLGPNDPGGPIPAWRGRVVLISSATGIELMTLFNPEATADAIFGLGAAAIPDQDADNIPDILVAGIGMVPAPTAEDPDAAVSGWLWWVMSTATAEPIRMGTGPVGSAGCEFLLPGESPHQFWAENMAAGALEFLPGLAGDLDGDGDVDEGDTNVFLEELAAGQHGSTRVGDLNGDGLLGIADLVILLQQMGFTQDMMEAIDPSQMLNALRQAGDNHFNNTGQFTGVPQCPFTWLGNCHGGAMGGLIDDPGGSGGCPGCVPTPCTGPCCNNPDPCCTNPCACNWCACHPCSAGCWTPDCYEPYDCSDCGDAVICDSDGDGWVNAYDCDSPCFLLPASACACGADIWQINGPAYVGVNQPFTMSAFWNGAFFEAEWQILSGGNLLTWTVQPTLPYRLTATAGSLPGVVQVRLQAKRYGRVCESTHTVHIVQYEPVTIRYATFIPCEAIATPGSLGAWVVPGFTGFYPFFGGDHRTFALASARYRSLHNIGVRTSDHYNATGPLVLSNDGAEFNVTRAYDDTDAQIVAGACPVSVFGAFVAIAQLLAHPTNHGLAFVRISSNRIKVRFILNASNPLTIVDFPIWGLWDFDITQTIAPDTGMQIDHVNVVGQRADFPAHEIYINGDSVHLYDPIPLGGHVLWLGRPYVSIGPLVRTWFR